MRPIHVDDGIDRIRECRKHRFLASGGITTGHTDAGLVCAEDTCDCAVFVLSPHDHCRRVAFDRFSQHSIVLRLRWNQRENTVQRLPTWTNPELETARVLVERDDVELLVRVRTDCALARAELGVLLRKTEGPDLGSLVGTRRVPWIDSKTADALCILDKF